MSATSRRPALVLVVPDLFARLTAKDRDPELDPKLPYLQRLLARGRVSRLQIQGFEATLCWLFGLPATDERRLPVASLTYRFDTGGKVPPHAIVRADPINLEPGIDEVVVTPAQDLEIDLGEARDLASALSMHFGDRGWRVEAPTPIRWYLELSESVALGALPPTRVMGRNLRAHLPSGEHGRFWLGVLNEIQMLLHDHPVNQAREAAGKRPINGVWLWGDGHAAEAEPVAWSRVWADDELPLALAEAAEKPYTAAPESLGDLGPMVDQGRYLIVLARLLTPVRRDSDAEWAGALTDLERQYFEPAWQGLGRIWDRIEIIPCDGRRFVITRSDRRRFWRRVQPLSSWAGPERGLDLG